MTENTGELRSASYELNRMLSDMEQSVTRLKNGTATEEERKEFLYRLQKMGEKPNKG